jgi:hypothetical protein
MIRHPLKGLAGSDVWAPNVAGAIADQKPLPLLCARTDFDTAVVHLDRFRRIELVENETLA